jgi:hypothetical protein
MIFLAHSEMHLSSSPGEYQRMPLLSCDVARVIAVLPSLRYDFRK